MSKENIHKKELGEKWKLLLSEIYFIIRRKPANLFVMVVVFLDSTVLALIIRYQCL